MLLAQSDVCNEKETCFEGSIYQLQLVCKFECKYLWDVLFESILD